MVVCLQLCKGQAAQAGRERERAGLKSIGAKIKQVEDKALPLGCMNPDPGESWGTYGYLLVLSESDPEHSSKTVIGH